MVPGYRDCGYAEAVAKGTPEAMEGQRLQGTGQMSWNNAGYGFQIRDRFILIFSGSA
jgi:hypothetical protein